jgi:hypothetical protein
MKIDIIKTILSICLSLILAYFLSTYKEAKDQLTYVIGVLSCLSYTSTLAFAYSFDYDKTSFLVKTVGFVSFLALLFVNIFFAFFDYTFQTFILVNGLVLILCTLITYSIVKSQH